MFNFNNNIGVSPPLFQNQVNSNIGGPLVTEQSLNLNLDTNVAASFPPVTFLQGPPVLPNFPGLLKPDPLGDPLGLGLGAGAGATAQAGLPGFGGLTGAPGVAGGDGASLLESLTRVLSAVLIQGFEQGLLDPGAQGATA